MRDILLTLVVLVGCVYTLKRPYIGILLWSWLSYMNPHRLTYGFAYSMPFAYIVAIILFISIFFSKEKKMIPINKITIVWIIYVAFMALTTVFAVFQENAMLQFIKVIKIQLIIFLTLAVITDKEKLDQLIWVIVLSLGYYSVKGGIFTIMSGGSFKVWGPEGSFIEDNNHLAVAILMTIPLMIYLQKIEQKKIVKHGLLFAIILSLFTVLGSQSRGALLAITAVGVFYWLKSKRKVLSGIIISILAFILVTFMPESWHARMNTIEHYDEDLSALGRFNAWEYAFNAANDNILGMGFESWDPSTFLIYAPNPYDVHAAHSIYFSVLADHGWIGLFLFLLIFYFGVNQCRRLIKMTKGDVFFYDLNLLMNMIQISFIAYFVGGAFLSLSYFDLPWHLLSFVVIISNIIYNNKNVVNKI